MSILYLFPDTNLFVQCCPLAEIDWSIWSTFDEIRLIISRPIQRELDRQKGRGNDRLGRRARRVHSTIRKMIVDNEDHITIQEKMPRVKLVLDPSCLPNPELAGRLDYNHVDDCLVGCVHSYRKAHPCCDIRLLTHDSGPMATAKMLSLPFITIPDAWLLPHERSDEERQIGRLKDELAKLKHTEPQIAIYGIDFDGGESESIEFEQTRHSGLSALEVTAYMDSLRREFPPATDFGPRERPQPQSSSPIGSVLSSMYRFVSASEDDIKNYKEKAYPQWVEECENTLRQLAASADFAVGPIVLRFAAQNIGSRPAKDVLVTISAHGNFVIRPLQEEQDGDGLKDSSGGLSLPLPPEPPKETWKTTLEMLSPAVEGLDPLTRFPGPEAIFPQARDPNAFYYKPRRPEVPVRSYCLECEQWRHGMEAEVFESEMCLISSDREIRGAIECTIYAENLSTPAREVIPVRGTITRVGVRAFADSLISDLRVRKEEQDLTPGE